MPDLLETLMSEKRLLQAAVLLVRSLKTINKPDMLEIGAVSDLRSYLVSQETVRTISYVPVPRKVDLLFRHCVMFLWMNCRIIYISNRSGATRDGPHIHLINKPVSDIRIFTRITSPTCSSSPVPKIEFEEDSPFKPSDVKESTPSSPLFHPSRQARFLSELGLKPNESPIDLSDLSLGNNQPLPSEYHVTANNPEGDSFSYMETLIESLAVLGKLGSAMDTISQKLPGEIFSLVENTLDEVEERTEYGRRAPILGLNETMGRTTKGVYIFTSESSAVDSTMPAKSTFLRASSLRLAALESSSKRVEHEILKDLFWTLYSKLDAVAQGLRIIYEVTNRIGSVRIVDLKKPQYLMFLQRRDFKDSSGAKPGSLFSIAEAWTPVQTEVCINDFAYIAIKSASGPDAYI